MTAVYFLVLTFVSSLVSVVSWQGFTAVFSASCLFLLWRERKEIRFSISLRDRLVWVGLLLLLVLAIRSYSQTKYFLEILPVLASGAFFLWGSHCCFSVDWQKKCEPYSKFKVFIEWLQVSLLFLSALAIAFQHFGLVYQFVFWLLGPSLVVLTLSTAPAVRVCLLVLWGSILLNLEGYDQLILASVFVVWGIASLSVRGARFATATLLASILLLLTPFIMSLDAGNKALETLQLKGIIVSWKGQIQFLLTPGVLNDFLEANHHFASLWSVWALGGLLAVTFFGLFCWLCWSKISELNHKIQVIFYPLFTLILLQSLGWFFIQHIELFSFYSWPIFVTLFLVCFYQTPIKRADIGSEVELFKAEMKGLLQKTYEKKGGI